jgi:sulfite exporter TauE/SafE
MFLLSAFLVGFLGSFHCAGMCGPIALALPVSDTSKSGIVTGRLLYNGGRIFTYSILGALAGLIGHTIAMAGFQKMLSISSGVLIILIASGALFYSRIKFLNGIILRYTSVIKNEFRKLFGQRSWRTLFMIGIVNGLLPCGFVYLALAAAAASGNISGSVSYMCLFGLGTLPMMLFISLAGNFFGLRFNRMITKATPFIAMAVAALLIVRGINMTEHSCCHR